MYNRHYISEEEQVEESKPIDIFGVYVYFYHSAPSLRRKHNFPMTLTVTVTCLVMLAVVVFVTGTAVNAKSTTYNSLIISGLHRKLLHKHHGSGSDAVVEPDRIWGDKCSTSDIVINQGPTDPLPSGIPTYTVEIMNVCTTGCDISGIHLSCGWFSSARLINPRLFRRLRYDDCLVNNGKPLLNGHTISFQYANTFRYPLSVSSVIC